MIRRITRTYLITTSRRPAIALAAFLALTVALTAEVGVTDAPKGVVVNPRNGKAYAAFPDLGVVKIVNGSGRVVTLKTGVNVKNLTLDPRTGRVYAMNRGPGTVSVIDPDTDAIIETLKADRGSLTALNPVTNKLYVSASTGTDPSVIDLATKISTTIHAGTEGNALSVNVKANKIYFVGYEDNFLTVVDGVTNEPARIEVLGVHQWDSAFNEKSGLLYLPTPNNNAVTVVDTRTGVVSMIGTGKVPMAAAINELTNRVYVVNYASSDVTVIDGASNQPIAAVKVGLWPQQIAINARTNMIYVVNTHANNVSVIDGRTNTVTATVPADKGPWAVAVNPVTNMIYVANRLSDKVTVIDGRTNTSVQR
jgi:YVTN family beta-propeller protein